MGGVRFARAILLATLVGCAGDAASAPDGGSGGVLRFVVSDQLAAPVNLSIDGTLSLILSSGNSEGLAVPPSAQWLTWTSAKPTDTTGTPVADDIGEVRVRVSGIRSTLEITNVIDDTTYITGLFLNETPSRVYIGVTEGATVSCASVLYGAADGIPGFTRIGYSRLLPSTEVRAYRKSGCTGPYVAWPASQLRDFTAKTGEVRLILTSAP